MQEMVELGGPTAYPLGLWVLEREAGEVGFSWTVVLMVGTVHALPTTWPTFVEDAVPSQSATRVLTVYLELLHAFACHVSQAGRL